MMKKQYMLFMPAAFCLTLLACTDENLTGNGMTNPEEQPTGETGKVVVDYTLDADEPASRADGSETDSPETSSSSPIRSLTYLLYEKTGTDEADNVYTLVKRREIRDITEKTQWPMTRENMTWNQREDLKDTLDRASVYKVVFVANAAASLHNEEQVLFNASLDVETPEGEEPQEPLLSFTDAYLKMPQKAFTDDNLFYVTAANFQYSEDADYVNQSLNLKRVVARTELSCIANVPGSEAVKERLETYFYPQIKGSESDVSSADKTIMAQICNNYKTSVTSLLADGQNLCGDYAGYIIPAPEGEESVTCKNKLEGLLKSLQNRPQEFEPAVQVEVLEQLTEGLIPTEDDNPLLFSKQYDWKDASEVKITFSSCADKVGLDGTCRKAEGTDPITWTVPVENGRINLTTFGTSGTGDASVKQEITSLAFYQQSTESSTENPLFTVTCQDEYPLKLDLAANQRISLELDPAVQILPKDGWYPTNAVEVTATVDLEEILSLNKIFADMQPPTSTGDTSSEGDDPTQGDETGNSTDTSNGYYENFKEQINSVIQKAGLGSLNEFKITVNIPNTSNPETYTCVPGWREVVNTPSGNE